MQKLGERDFFTGKERDAETGLDFFEARYMSSAQGRFTSTDPVIMAPHKVTDPQNWNLYSYARNNPLRFTDPSGEDIVESVDDKYRKRYEAWKKEYLSTEAGRKQWAKYDNDHSITLTITVDKDHNQGAEAGNYQFDQNTGKLTAATITLGRNIGSGIPSTGDYPITGTLGDSQSGSVLAVAKFAHEFGHVNVTSAEGILHQQQDALMTQYGDLYNQLHSFSDPRFGSIVQQLGATPGDVKTRREHAAEANTIPYLRDRFPGKSMPSAVKQAIQNYEKGKP